MELKNYGSGLHELTFEQASGINGGESLWYWVAYGVGAVANAVVQTAAQNIQNLLDKYDGCSSF